MTDGKWVGYFAQGQLKKIEITGGAPVKICDFPSDSFGATWGADGMIVFGQARSIMRVPATGGTPETLIAAGEGEWIFGPSLLPNGEWLLFTVTKAQRDTRWDEAQIVVESLESGERKVVVQRGSDARYIPTGHLVYALGNDLFAVGFDANTLEKTGETVSIISGTRRATAPMVNTGTANYDFSDSGILAYAPGRNAETLRRTLVWVDRNGREEPLEFPPDLYRTPRISPDGTRLALEIGSDEYSDIWICDLVRKIKTKLTHSEAVDCFPLWTADGEEIIFWSSREKGGVYSKAADGTGEVDRLISAEEKLRIHPASWADNGKTLVFEVLVRNSFGDIGADVGIISMQGDHKSKSLLQTRFWELNPNVSFNGRWMAYVSGESGPFEIYVCPYPEIERERELISASGGAEPRWSPDGKELFYRGGDSMMVVTVETDPMLKPSVPKSVFKDNYYSGMGHNWDLSPDGKRFLMIKGLSSESTEATPQEKINFVLNWFEELKDKVPVD